MAARDVVTVTPRKNGTRMRNFSPSVTPTSKRISGKAAKGYQGRLQRMSATSLR